MNQGNNVQQWLLKSTNADHTEGVREGEGSGQLLSSFSSVYFVFVCISNNQKCNF